MGKGASYSRALTIPLPETAGVLLSDSFMGDSFDTKAHATMVSWGVEIYIGLSRYFSG